MTTRRAGRRAASTVVALGLVLTGCTGGQAQDASSSAAAPPTTTAAAEPTSSEPSATEAAAPARTSEPLGTLEVSYLPPDPARFRRDTGTQSAQHWLPINVVTDDTAERWGDWFLFVATVAHHPKTGAEGQVPTDLVEWLDDNPSVEVLDKRKLQVDGQPAVLLDVKRKGGLLLGGEGFSAPDGDSFERFVLWQVSGSWVVAQASTFGGAAALAAKDTPEDPFMSYLAELRFE